MNTDLQAEVLLRLKAGRTLDGIGLSFTDGRIDLRGVIVPDPVVVERHTTTLAKVDVVDTKTIFENVALERLNFSGAYLSGALFFGCRLHDCLFDGANLQSIACWGNMVSRCSFQSADLRHAGLGGVEKGKRNRFQEVNFSKADLRHATFGRGGAEFSDCVFRNTKLENIEFQGSVFERCIFQGELREVRFYRLGYKAEGFPPNEMRDVDFSQAKLRMVEFRELDLEHTQLPIGEGHIAITNYPEALDYLLGELKDKSDLLSRKLYALLENRRKWAGRKQKTGVLNKADLFEYVGEDAERLIAHLLSVYRQKHVKSAEL